jgi:hypothetical protein
MATLPEESNGPSGATLPIEPFFYLLSAVLLLSTVPTVTNMSSSTVRWTYTGMALIRVTTFSACDYPRRTAED